MVLYYETKNELLHYGIKGMKWGVRRSREELGYLRKSTSKTTVRGHDATPKKSTPNTTIDHMRDDAKIFSGKSISDLIDVVDFTFA